MVTAIPDSPGSAANFNLVFMGSSAFATPTLEHLIQSGCRIAAVVTQPDKPAGRGNLLKATPVAEAALARGLRVERPATLRDEPARALFQGLAPDIIVLVAYGKIVPPWLIALPRFGIVNLHGSLLPRYRGAAPVHWAIANGDAETGVCTMRIDEGLDTGPVYLSASTSIGPDETVEALSARLAAIGAPLVIRTLDGICRSNLAPAPQDSSSATFAPILKKSDGLIDWTAPARAIHNRIRAFTPWPGAFTHFQGAVCKIRKSKVGAPCPGVASGAVAALKPALTVACGDELAIEIVEAQPENGKPMPGAAFANGRRIQPGDRFE